MQGAMIIAGTGALTVTAVSVLAERRRSRRHDIDAVGWVPWPLVTILGSIAALFAFALAIRFGE